MAMTAFFAGILFWIVAGQMVQSRFGDQAGAAFMILFWLFGGCGFMIFAITYWSCPVCKHYFPRGSNGRSCTHCHTRFDA